MARLLSPSPASAALFVRLPCCVPQLVRSPQCELLYVFLLHSLFFIACNKGSGDVPLAAGVVQQSVHQSGQALIVGHPVTRVSHSHGQSLS